MGNDGMKKELSISLGGVEKCPLLKKEITLSLRERVG